MTPRVVVLSAPSGVGKTTIALALVGARRDAVFSVSATTRPPRPEERDGDAYHFLARREFERRIGTGEFLEWAEYAGELYGTLRSEVERGLAAGRHVVLDIDVAGARQVRDAYPPPRSVSVFILPPSGRELGTRLRQRRTEAPDQLQRRLRIAQRELGEADSFDFVIVNDVLTRAVDAVSKIVDGDRAIPTRPPNYEALVRELGENLDNGKEC